MTGADRPDSQKSRQELLDEIYLLRDVAGEREQRSRGLTARLTAQDNELAEKSGALASVLASRSWRITAPLRCVTRWLHGQHRATASRRTGEFPPPAEPPVDPAVAPRVATAAPSTAPTRPSGDRRCLFVDVTELAAREGRTGIQRVVREILGALLASPPADYDVEPVYAAPDGGWHYARAFTSRFMGKANVVASDMPIATRAGDVFLGLDHSMDAVIAHAADLDHMRTAGVRLWFVCNDTLPLAHPEWFPDGVPDTYRRWFAAIAKVADGIACISQTTQADVAHWIAALGLQRAPPVRLAHFYLGSDPRVEPIDNVVPETLRPALGGLRGRSAFLMVGTLEPRKGHAQALEAFNLLWERGSDAVLVVAGLPGWNTGVIQRRIRHHEELGKRLYWFADAGDAVLEELYTTCAALLAPSEGEGFGLPLVEATHHALPILCRDLPVFREVAGNHAAYFSGTDASDLALAIERWLAGARNGKAASASTMRSLTWAQSAQQLLSVVVDDVPSTAVPSQKHGADDT